MKDYATLKRDALDTPISYWSSIKTIEISYLRVYPNPASNQIIIDAYIQGSNTGAIEIVDALGAVVYFKQYGSNTLNDKIDSRAWTSGLYTVRVPSTDGNRLSQKVIINH